MGKHQHATISQMAHRTFYSLVTTAFLLAAPFITFGCLPLVPRDGTESKIDLFLIIFLLFAVIFAFSYYFLLKKEVAFLSKITRKILYGNFIFFILCSLWFISGIELLNYTQSAQLSLGPDCQTHYQGIYGYVHTYLKLFFILSSVMIMFSTIFIVGRKIVRKGIK